MGIDLLKLGKREGILGFAELNGKGGVCEMVDEGVFIRGVVVDVGEWLIWGECGKMVWKVV